MRHFPRQQRHAAVPPPSPQRSGLHHDHVRHTTGGVFNTDDEWDILAHTTLTNTGIIFNSGTLYNAGTLANNSGPNGSYGDNSPRVTPSVALEAALSDRDAFTESGGTISKRFGASTMNTVDMPVGAALSQDFDYGKGTATPEFSAYYVRRLADTRATGDMTLLGSTSTASVSGASTGRSLVRANLGGRITTQDNVDFSLFYNGEFGDHYANNGMTREVKYNF